MLPPLSLTLDIVYQYYLLDAEGLGIADYVSLRNATYEELNREQERLMGGLGSDRIQLTKEEALSLVNYYGKKTYYWEKELPGNVDEYIHIINDYEAEIDMFTANLLRIKNENDALIYCIVTVPQDIQKISINLKAPKPPNSSFVVNTILGLYPAEIIFKIAYTPARSSAPNPSGDHNTCCSAS